MLADPQSITYAAVAKSLPAIGRNETQSEYKLNDGGVVYNLILSHQFKARNRVVARISRTAASADPLIPSQNILASMTCTFTMDFPTVGYTTTDVQNLANAMTGFLTGGTILKLANGET